MARLGADIGCDTVGGVLDITALARLLDDLEKEDNLPRIILYTLNPADYYPMFTLADAFRGVTMGMPWWFNDHKRGMEQFFETASELSFLPSLIGMLTDSRSFLSYARHDYFRMVLASYLARFEGEDMDGLKNVMQRLSYGNAKELLGL
jgi:glucuronate isomerase